MQPDGRLPRLNRDEMANQDGKGWVNMGEGGGRKPGKEGEKHSQARMENGWS